MLAGGGDQIAKMGGSALLQRPLPFTLPQPKLFCLSTGKGWAEVEQVVTRGRPAGGRLSARLSAQAGLLVAGVRRPRWGVLNLQDTGLLLQKFIQEQIWKTEVVTKVRSSIPQNNLRAPKNQVSG